MIGSTTNFMINLGGSFIIIKNVPCHKCLQCEEASFIGTTASRVNAIIDKLKDALTEAAVVEIAV